MGPWEKYAEPDSTAKPWEKYGAAPERPTEGATAAPATQAPTDGFMGLKSPLGLPEAALAAGTGTAGSFAGNVAGLGAIPLHATGAIKTDPTQVKESVQR